MLGFGAGVQVSSGNCLYRLEGHTGVVTSVAFCRHIQHWLVTTAEDRTFKVRAACHGMAWLWSEQLQNHTFQPTYNFARDMLLWS